MDMGGSFLPPYGSRFPNITFRCYIITPNIEQSVLQGSRCQRVSLKHYRFKIYPGVHTSAVLSLKTLSGIT